MTNELSSSEARELIRQLNRMDLERTEYRVISDMVGKLIIGVGIRAITPRMDTRLYRGVVYKDKPHNVGRLGHPPTELVKDFQRCNAPRNPMFYCSVDPATIFYELDVKAGDSLYLSKWSVIKEFWVLQLAPNMPANGEPSPLDLVLAFFETKFAQPIHETYSSQYKITAAIAEHMTTGDITSGSPLPIGGLTYPSVSHPGRSENVCIRPAIVERCLRLDYVEELCIQSVDGRDYSYRHSDFSSRFGSERIEWAGEPLHWKIAPGQSITVKVEPDGWVARDAQGNILNPG